MKKTYRLLFAAFFLPVLGYVSSCAKSKADEPSTVDCTTVDQATNTYALKIKGIIDPNCATVGCHDAIFYSSGVKLSDYDGVKAAFETQDALCAVKQEQGCIAMPQGATKLADSLITYLQCWKENNYPQ
jgi:catabolite regulation protein CreA